MKRERLDCPYDFTSRCTMGRCDCKPKELTNTIQCGDVNNEINLMPNGTRWVDINEIKHVMRPQKQETLEENLKIWDDLFAILAWKFKPTKSGDMYLDCEKVYDELKDKFELKRI